MSVDNPPAFPAYAVGPNDDFYRQEGMDLRDYFAGQALGGLLAANATYAGETSNRHLVAADAYAHADAMLAARATEAHSREEG